MLTHLFSMLVQPILEYSSNATWGSHYTLNMSKIEKVQQRATCLPQLYDKSYTES